MCIGKHEHIYQTDVKDEAFNIICIIISLYVFT